MKKFKHRLIYSTGFIVILVFIAALFFAIDNTDNNTVRESEQSCDSEEMSVIFNDFRFQFLSETLFRIEKKYDKGFEDRSTFLAVDRKWSCVKYEKSEQVGSTTLSTKNYSIVINHPSQKFQNIRISSTNGELLFEQKEEKIQLDFLPDPSGNFKVWAMADTPRIVAPPWGATPVPDSQSETNLPFSGWEVDNEAWDNYIFLNGEGGYKQFRENFLRLTGSIPMPPLYTFGLWNSRYHPYTEDSALQTIRAYREKNIPLDVFVLDTDWRVGGSTGYTINKELFPDLKRFTLKAHNENVYLALNDHPEAVSESALDSKELNFRYKNLTQLLDLGIDSWWYDRNWHAHLKTPASGISKEVWGMRVYSDITQRIRPDRRPLILSNVDGIDQGEWTRPSHPAAHRYPIWWTGDTKSEWAYLQKSVSNSVNSGIARLMPYVSDDIGGHFGLPTPEFYIRSVQYGTFSPILRLHSSGRTRYPWDYGISAETITSEYIRLRYRLLPLIYASARQAYEDGTPLLRRCDLYWPEYSEAKNDHQYLFGDDLLVAPIIDGKGLHPIPDDLLHTEDGQQGLLGMYFDNTELLGEPTLVRVDRNVDFNWGEGKGSEPVKGVSNDNFSVRWEGKIGPIPQTGEYDLGVTADDGLRLWIDEKLIIDHWKDQGATLHTGRLQLQKDKIYNLRVEYYDHKYKASCKMVWWNLDDQSIPQRSLWVPPGGWQDLWTGKTVIGPKTIAVSSPLRRIPIFARLGGIILSIPQIQHTNHNPWDVVVVDAFIPNKDGKTLRTLYEDDGSSVGYQRGEFRKTPLVFSKAGSLMSFRIDGTEGEYLNNIDKRTWIVRFHLNQGDQISKVTVDNKELIIQRGDIKKGEPYARFIAPSIDVKGMIFLGQGEAPPPEAGSVLEVLLPNRDVRNEVVIGLQP